MAGEFDDVTTRMAEDLRGGAFPPGTWLKQIDLQERYGVGRAAIRKALETLSVRRLIRHELNRGYRVHPLDDDDTRHVLELRAVLESGFADKIVRHATEAEIDVLGKLADKFIDLAQRGENASLYAVNLEFHRRLLDCARNPLIVPQIEELRIRTSPAPVSQWLNFPQIQASADEHFAMVAALRARQAAALRELIVAHIMKNDVRATVEGETA